MLLLEADVATMGHSYDRMVQTPRLLSAASGLGVHPDLLATATLSLLAQVPRCMVQWDLGPPNPTWPIAAITVLKHPSGWQRCGGGGTGPAQGCSSVL